MWDEVIGIPGWLREPGRELEGLWGAQVPLDLLTMETREDLSLWPWCLPLPIQQLLPAFSTFFL